MQPAHRCLISQPQATELKEEQLLWLRSSLADVPHMHGPKYWPYPQAPIYGSAHAAYPTSELQTLYSCWQKLLLESKAGAVSSSNP